MGEVKSEALKNLLNDLSVEYGVDLESLGASLEENVHFSQEDITSLLKKHCEGVLKSKPQEPASALVPEELNTLPSVQIEEPNTFEEPEEPNTLEQPDDLKEPTIEEPRIPEEPQETETPEEPQETNIAEKPEEPNVPKKPSISEKSSTPEPNAQPSSDLINFKASVQATLNSIQEKLQEGEVYAFQEIIKQCSLEVSQEMTQDFHNRVIHLKSTLGDKLPLDNFLDLVYEWYDSQKPIKKHYDLKEKLQQTIQEYQILLNEKIQAGEDPRPIQELLKALEKQSRKQSQHTKTKPKKERPFQEKCEMGLHEIFLFYAKQHQMLGRTPTFESINKDSELWNIGKFIKFCNDFGLTGRNKSYPTISKTQAQQLFKKFSSNSRVMSLNQFFECLESVAVLFFNSNFDLTTGEKISELSVEEKKQKLYLFLEVHDPNAYLNKAKGFGLPFSSDKLSRIPENDLSKRYKFRDHSQVKKRLQEWKENKQTDRSFSVSKKKVKYQMPKIVKRNDLVTWQDLHTKKQPNLLDKEDLMQLFTEDDCKEIFSKR